jgi:hypothetical protein
LAAKLLRSAVCRRRHAPAAAAIFLDFSLRIIFRMLLFMLE